MSRFNSSRARRRKRWRLPRLLSLGFSRRSMKIGMKRPQPASARLVYPHVPVHQPADLAFGVAAADHPLHEFGVPLLRHAVLLGAEADHRQQILDLPEHALLDDFAQFFITRP